MGSTTKSGSPVETRGLTQDISQTFGSIFGGGQTPGNVFSAIGDPLQRLAGQASQNFLGFSPGSVGLGEAVSRSLRDPSVAAREAMMPIFAQQQSQGINDLLAKVGGAGGRFGGSAGALGALFGSNLAAQQGRVLGELGLQGQQVQNQGINALLQGLNQSAATGQGGIIDVLSQLLGFAAPGPPVIQPGLGSQLLNLGGTIGGAALGGPIGGAIAGRLFPSGATG